MVPEKRDDEENLSDGSEYVPEASPTRKQKTSRMKKDWKHDESAGESSASTPTARSKSSTSNLRKYIRLKGCYNDNYRKLLNTTISEAGHIAVDDDLDVLNPMLNLPPSNLGGTTWTADEKRILFRAVARYGRDDLPRIASSLNKSEQEVKVYLDHMREALLQHARTLLGGLQSAGDEMHTAIEISHEGIKELDTCADALAWYQFTWEAKQEQKAYGDFWLLDRELADEVTMALEGKDDKNGTPTGRSERSNSSRGKFAEPSLTTSIKTPSSDKPGICNPLPAAELLNLSNFIGLSEKVFMISKDPEWDWRSYQDAGKPNKSQSKLGRAEENPAMFRTAFDDFHRVVVSLTKRVMHTALHLATSRLRANDNAEQRLAPDPRVGRRDVLAALQILNLKENSFEFWATLPLRHKVDWLYQTDTDNKSKMRQVTAEEAERYLRHEGRINHSKVEDIFQPDSAEDLEESDSQQDDSDSSSQDLDDTSTTQLLRQSADPYDQYLELLDVQASRVQERNIWSLLGKEVPGTARLSEPDLIEPKMPKRIPTVEQGTSSFADWRAWTERRAEWEMDSEDGPRDSENDEWVSEEGKALSWISVPQSTDARDQGTVHAVESDERISGVARGRRGWSDVKISKGSKRRHSQTSTELETTFDMDMPSRKRHEEYSPGEMEEGQPTLKHEAALQGVQPSDNESAWSRSPSPAEEFGDLRGPRFDDSE